MRKESQCPFCEFNDTPYCAHSKTKSTQCQSFSPKENRFKTITPTNTKLNIDKFSPSHYSRLRPEPIEVMKAWFPDSMLANAIKYIGRAGHKKDESDIDDIKKAINYLHYYLFDCFVSFPDKEINDSPQDTNDSD